jgi:hypothetical protein
MERGGLTVFLIANDVAKCFALASAMFRRAALVGGCRHDPALVNLGDPVGRSRSSH